MRIRKRFPPPSDPQLNNPLMVQLNTKNESPPSDLPNLSLPQPSDQPAPVTGIKPTTTWLLFGGNNNNIPAKLEQKDIGGEDVDEKLWREKKEIFINNIDNDNKKKISFLSTPQLGSLLPQSSSSSNQDGRWCEEDHKVIPLKKRSRDNYHHQNNNNNNNNNRSSINTMKSKTNKKCPQENGNEEEQEHEEHYHRGVDNINSDHKVDHHHHVIISKKNKRGSVILEGSRCSRVNGRGWRCCQQTLVGYSLCEHHLGKGRLRSMNNTVRNSMNNNSNNNKKKKNKGEGKKEKSLPNDYEYYDVDDDDDDVDDKKKSSSLMATTTKKKMKKVGVVKARSLSSLLGQTENAVAMMIVDNDNKNEE